MFSLCYNENTTIWLIHFKQNDLIELKINQQLINYVTILL